MTRAPRITDRRWSVFRRQVMQRDNGRCRYRLPGCTEVATQVDHLMPRRLGAVLFDEANCFSVCHSCHREKERRERAGGPIGVFSVGDALEMRQLSAYTSGKTGRDRRSLPPAADSSGRPLDSSGTSRREA